MLWLRLNLVLHYVSLTCWSIIFNHPNLVPRHINCNAFDCFCFPSCKILEEITIQVRWKNLHLFSYRFLSFEIFFHVLFVVVYYKGIKCTFITWKTSECKSDSTGEFGMISLICSESLRWFYLMLLFHLRLWVTNGIFMFKTNIIICSP